MFANFKSRIFSYQTIQNVCGYIRKFSYVVIAKDIEVPFSAPLPFLEKQNSTDAKRERHYTKQIFSLIGKHILCKMTASVM